MRPNLVLCVPLFLAGITAFLPAQDLYDRSLLRTVELQFSGNWEQELETRKSAGLKEYYPADMTVDGVLYPNVGVRYKGNYTYWGVPAGQKKSLNISLDEFEPDQNIYSHNKLILNNQAFDPSVMREVIAYGVMNQFIPSPRACFVKVVINGEEYGIYSNIEHIGAPFCESRFGSGDGFRYKAVPPWVWPDTLVPPPPPTHIALQDLGGVVANAERAYQIKNREQDPDHHLGILDAIDILSSASLDVLVESLEPFLDTDLAIWHLALNNILVSLDAYYSSGQNYYLYQDPIHNRVAILPWDFNMCFGIYGTQGATMSPTFGKGDTDRPLYNRLVNRETLRQEYLSHVHFATVAGLDPQFLHSEIDALALLIDTEIQSDSRLGTTYSGWQNAVANLKNFIQNRHDFLVNHSLLDVDRPTFVEAGHFPIQPSSADSVKLWANVTSLVDSVEAVTAHVRTIGGFQSVELFDDGLHGDGSANDGVFAAHLSPLDVGSKVEYYFDSNCELSKGVSFSPTGASTSPLSFIVNPDPESSDILLNEFVARNVNGPTDETGEREDWIELYNRSSQTIDLSGMWLSDDLNETLKWQIPVGTILSAKETLLIWADNDPLDGPLHAEFKLSSGGEEISLTSSDGTTLLDFYIFGAQEEDVSTGRIDDGEVLWVTLPSPTPNAHNQISCGVRAYDATDSTSNLASIDLEGAPSLGTDVDLNLSDFPAGKNAYVVLGTSSLSEDYAESDVISLVGDIRNQSVTVTDVTGSAKLTFSVPSHLSLVGRRFYLQAATIGSDIVASNGLEVVICP